MWRYLANCGVGFVLLVSSQLAIGARPRWIEVPEATLRAAQMSRVTAEGATPELCREELQRAIEGAIDRRIVLEAEEVGLPKELESRIWPEEFDPTWMKVEEYFEPVADATSATKTQGWAQIHFLPKFTQELRSRVANVQRLDRLQRVGIRFALTLLAIAASFGYLQSRQRRGERQLLPAADSR